MNSRLLIFVLALFAIMIPPNISAQMPSQPQPSRTPPFNTQPETEDADRIKIEKDMAKKANHERQEQLKRDTDQLLKLATELKESVDKSNENMLSLDVIKKADDIERLAHSVREKMRGSY